MPERAPGDKPIAALPRGSCFDGVLVASGPASIEGRVRGQVVGTSSLEIGSGAEIDGPVDAPAIRVAGQVRGDLTASERLELTGTARVAGRISTPRFSAEEGAQVDGAASVGNAREAGETPAES